MVMVELDGELVQALALDYPLSKEPTPFESKE